MCVEAICARRSLPASNARQNVTFTVVETIDILTRTCGGRGRVAKPAYSTDLIKQSSC